MISGGPLVLYRRYILTRLYVAVSIALTLLNFVIEPFSIHYLALASLDASMFPIYIGLFLCFACVVDIIINDFLPDKYFMMVSYDNRHLLYTGLSLISFSVSFLLLNTFSTSTVVSRLWLDGSIAMAVAILDMFSRHRG